MPLIVGLGNPGAEYEGTPHNVGFAVVSRLAERHGAAFRRSRAGKADEAMLPGAAKTILLRPLSYMNLSGGPVSAALHWHRVPIQELLVVCDDVNLPVGHLRLREKGGPGGQKGLRSIIEALGTDEFARLRLGMGGGDPGADVARHVLSRISRDLRPAVEQAVDLAADAVECWLREGLAAAMNRFNTKRQPIRNNSTPSGGESPPDENSPKGES